MDSSTITKTLQLDDQSTSYKRVDSLASVYTTLPTSATTGNTKTSSYTYGDKIPITTNTGTLTSFWYLTLPRSPNSDYCDYMSYAKFMESNSTTQYCYWIPTYSDTLKSRCLNEFNFQVLAGTVFSTVANPNTLTDFIQVTVAEIISVDSFGVETLLPNTTATTTYSAGTSTCSSAVIGAHYYFTISPTGSISSVTASFKVTDVVNPSYVKLSSSIIYINGVSRFKTGINFNTT